MDVLQLSVASQQASGIIAIGTTGGVVLSIIKPLGNGGDCIAFGLGCINDVLLLLGDGLKKGVVHCGDGVRRSWLTQVHGRNKTVKGRKAVDFGRDGNCDCGDLIL